MDRVSAGDLREIMRLADKLKSYVCETNDPRYSLLFLEASEALQNRAQALARGENSPEPVKPVNIVC